MAKIIGKAGQYQGDQLHKRTAFFLLSLFVIGALGGFATGFLSALRSSFWIVVFIAVIAPLFWWVFKESRWSDVYQTQEACKVITVN